ncbi:hypothetical protein QBC36DRAFT_77607 [Triangularia setosa]|uniref:Uncharacterized protein n=1 Tax=Triangularia setosa TaxID=2587417 RepID=A0AAN6WF36_9PEZI|nr:hypothetical protein QBC36DRAFT_77607 [Podospora setosa]
MMEFFYEWVKERIVVFYSGGGIGFLEVEGGGGGGYKMVSESIQTSLFSLFVPCFLFSLRGVLGSLLASNWVPIDIFQLPLSLGVVEGLREKTSKRVMFFCSAHSRLSPMFLFPIVIVSL